MYCQKMKIIKKYTFVFLCLVFLFAVTSCVVTPRHDNGKHKGWYNKSSNPNNANSTNPGKSKGKGHK